MQRKHCLAVSEEESENRQVPRRRKERKKRYFAIVSENEGNQWRERVDDSCRSTQEALNTLVPTDDDQGTSTTLVSYAKYSLKACSRRLTNTRVSYCNESIVYKLKIKRVLRRVLLQRPSRSNGLSTTLVEP